MLTCKILELKGQIPEVKWNALWEDYRKFIEKKNKKINQLEKQLEHYKVKEIEKANESILQAQNDYLERCIKANTRGGSNE